MAEATGARRAAWPFLLVGGAWFAVMAGANLATPLYAGYERRFGFSSAALTLVFATYALVLAPALLVFGQLSDRLGRRRGIAAGVGAPSPGALALRACQQHRLAVRGARSPGARRRDARRSGQRGARRARPAAGGAHGGADGGARAGGRERGGPDLRRGARRVGAGAAGALLRRRARADAARRARRAADPGAGRGGRRPLDDPAPARPGRDPRPLRAAEHHLGRGVG